MLSKDQIASFWKVYSMRQHSQLGALDWDEQEEKKKWRKPWFLVVEPTAQAIRMAIAQKENPRVPISKPNLEVR